MEEEEGAIFRRRTFAVRISLFFVSEKRRSVARVKLKEIVESRLEAWRCFALEVLCSNYRPARRVMDLGFTCADDRASLTSRRHSAWKLGARERTSAPMRFDTHP